MVITGGGPVTSGIGKIHIDYHCIRATRAKALHKGPADAEFTETTEKPKNDIFEMEGLAPGEHKFKIVGINAAGEGPESDEAIIQVT